ncbi:glycosyl transferase family 2 [Sulfurovum sp. TSL6]|uniref:glycosyltransferase n=1 Tax=Sulfurovum sp. TSL6 TaxID=2826995 RepID=UPI001CC6CA81|nr:glycosyltransferase [Sulfurovum sp. TSL6]GIU00478.1 glycosyl transferase family 2 [Sulfurovum sp. TSL6]
MIERTEAEIMKNWKGDLSSPLVSICTRTYNLENFIAESLDSFLMQETDFPFEIVIDDDCSTDRTVIIIKKYMEKFPNIINANFLEKNIGVRMNFIKNMQRARGKYIAPCDGDDYWTDALNLQKHVDFLEKNDEYVVTYSSLEAIYEGEERRSTFNWNTKDRESLEIQKRFLGTGICAVCFRNVDIIQEYPMEHYCAPIDDNFLGSMLGAYGKGKFLKDIKAAKYRQHGDSDYSSKSIYEKAAMYEQTFFALYMYYSRIGNKHLSDYFYNKVMEYSFVVHGKFYYAKLLLKSFIIQGIQYITMFLKGIIIKVIRLVKRKY